MVKAGLWEVPADFRCRKSEFAEYLDANTAYDQQQRMGQMYWAIRNGEILGYMMLALGHAVEERQADLGIDTYGHLPALLITRLATDERHDRQGIGRQMTAHAIEIVGRMALDAGCRIILANSDHDAVGFYEKMGFARFPSELDSGLDRPLREAEGRTETEGHREEGLVPMYLDLGIR